MFSLTGGAGGGGERSGPLACGPMACAPDAESCVQGSGGTSTELMGSRAAGSPSYSQIAVNVGATSTYGMPHKCIGAACPTSVVFLGA